MNFSGFNPTPSETVVSNDGFWPDLPMADFQAIYRLPEEYAEATLAEGMMIGMAWANRQLVAWKEEQALAGYANMAAVPCGSLGDAPTNLLHYRRAALSYAKAYLLQQFPTINRRESAANEGKESVETEAKFLEFANRAINDFLARRHIVAEAI